MRTQHGWFGRRAKLTLGGGIVAVAVLVAVLAPLVSPFDPDQQDLTVRLRPPVWSEGASPPHWLGTDNFGRDLLSRLIFGARVSMLVGFLAVVFAGVVGSALGMVAGYRGGRIEQLVMRLADAQLALPHFLLAILIVASFGGSALNLILVLGISGWMVYARVTFGLTRTLREMSYVSVAVAQGAGDAHIITRHIMPQIVPVLTVVSALQVAQMILVETALSFLGLGIPPPAASWGNMLAEGRDRLAVAPWIANLSGLAIVIVVWGVNMLGNGLREHLDPKSTDRHA